MNAAAHPFKGNTVMPLSLGAVNISSRSSRTDAWEQANGDKIEVEASERLYMPQKRSRVSHGPDDNEKSPVQQFHSPRQSSLDKVETIVPGQFSDSTPSNAGRREEGNDFSPHEDYRIVIPTSLEVLPTPPSEHTTHVKPYHISPIEYYKDTTAGKEEDTMNKFASFQKADEVQPLNNISQMSRTQAIPPRREAAVSCRQSATPLNVSTTSILGNFPPLPTLNPGKLAQQSLTSPQKARTLSKGPKCSGAAPPSPTTRLRDGRIKVVVRKRPFMPGEAGSDCLTVTSPQVTLEVTKQRVDLSEYTQRSDFSFDEAFDVSDNNQLVYTSCALELLDVALGGGRASCFAYGQTGSGKTHTMMGNTEENGLYLLAASDLFRRLPFSHRLDVSFYEIYCNSLFDLLNVRSPVVLREGSDRRVNVCGLSWHPVSSTEQLWSLISAGMEQRKTGSTSANEQSSRSHAIMTIRITDTTNPEYHGVINFVDLAGSERAADTANNEKQTRLEGAEINKSLLALKECIRALDERKKHVPFRGSRLTEVLRDSFTGNSKTVMIANISPSSVNFEHTANTLRYSFRVKGLSIASVAPDKARNAPRAYPAPSRGRSRTQEHGSDTPLRNYSSRNEKDFKQEKKRPSHCASPGPSSQKLDRATANELYRNVLGKGASTPSATRGLATEDSLSLTPDARRKTLGLRAPPSGGNSFISVYTDTGNSSIQEDYPSASMPARIREEMEERLRREVMEKIQRDLGREIQFILDERDTLIAELRKENAGLRRKIETLEPIEQHSISSPSLLSTVPHRHQDVMSTAKPSDAFVVKSSFTPLENSEI